MDQLSAYGSPFLSKCLGGCGKKDVPMRARGSTTTFARWSTQHDTKLLMPCWPLGLWNAAHARSIAARDVFGAKIPTEESPRVCTRSLKICILYHTYHTPLAIQRRPRPQRHAGAWSGGRQEGIRPWRARPPPGSDNGHYVNQRAVHRPAAAQQLCSFSLARSIIHRHCRTHYRSDMHGGASRTRGCFAAALCSHTPPHADCLRSVGY
jgi:hypothetical protein